MTLKMFVSWFFWAYHKHEAIQIVCHIIKVEFPQEYCIPQLHHPVLQYISVNHQYNARCKALVTPPYTTLHDTARQGGARRDWAGTAVGQGSAPHGSMGTIDNIKVNYTENSSSK